MYFNGIYIFILFDKSIRKLLMPMWVLPNQSSFVLDWSITDNIIITQEIIHFMQKKKKNLIRVDGC